MDKENLKKLLLSFDEADYASKIDLHMHSNESDGILEPAEIVQQALKLGKKYISIADHNTIEAYLSTNILSNDILIPAAEFDCFYNGGIIHIIGYGIDIDNKEFQGICASNQAGRKSRIYRLFKLRSPEKVIYTIKKAGGIPVLAHPRRYFSLNFDSFIKPLADMGLEGIEAYYPYKGLKSLFIFHSDAVIKEAAEKYNLIKTGGTDFHGRKLA